MSRWPRSEMRARCWTTVQHGGGVGGGDAQAPDGKLVVACWHPEAGVRQHRQKNRRHHAHEHRVHQRGVLNSVDAVHGDLEHRQRRRPDPGVGSYSGESDELLNLMPVYD